MDPAGGAMRHHVGVTGRHVVVVGGGIAGLAAAYALERTCPPGTTVVVVEGARALGGKLRTSTIEGLAVDEGAEAFLAAVPEGIELARAVGLGADLVHPATGAASIAVDATLRPLPTGTVLGVPGDVESLAASAVLTPAGLARVRAEAAGPAVTDDVSVGALVRRRLGDEVVDRLVDPLLGGVYAGRADSLSLQATVPALAAALRRPGSLLAAARAARPPAARTGPVFASLRHGLGALVPAVAARLDAEVLLGRPVREFHRSTEGFRLAGGPVPAPTYLAADAVVVAVPAAPAARLLGEVAPAAATELAGIDYASTAIVTLAYRAITLPPGSGVLVAATEGLAVKALTFSSQKWAQLAGPLSIVRASVGRYCDEAVLQRSDADLVALATTEVAALTGVTARPLASRVTRWGGALPQYAVGHLDRVRRIDAAVSAVPGLAVAGAAYGGVGVPACIRSGYAAADRIAAYLTVLDLRQSRHD